MRAQVSCRYCQEAEMSFYAVQSMVHYQFKLGFSDNVLSRFVSLETFGPNWVTGIADGHDRKFESHVFDYLSSDRIGDPRNEHKPYEVFTPSIRVRRFLSGQYMRAEGFRLRTRPRDPLKQTAKQWCQLVSASGDGVSVAARAAKSALIENARLHQLVRKVYCNSHVGGWDLTESLGGFPSTYGQLSFDKDWCSEFKWKDGVPFRRVCHKPSGNEFLFPIFVEWWLRENNGDPVPKGAIAANFPIMSVKVRKK
jgi:hypothetical protein